MRDRLPKILETLSRPAVAVGGATVIGLAVLGYAWYSTTAHYGNSYVAATRGPITEEVDVSAVVKAAESTNLSFQVPGQVAHINVAVGDHVSAGQVLISLDASAASAALAAAKANLEVQEAKLASLTAGTRPEQLAIDETSAAQARAALSDAIQSAYVYADDAVHVKADQVFTNPRTSQADLIVTVPNADLATQVKAERVALTPLLTAWQKNISAMSDPEALAPTSEANLRTIGTFLDDLASALAETPAGGAVSASTLSGYQTSVNAARVSVSSALSALTTADTAYKSAAGTLALAKAGATPEDIAAQKAAVDSAQAAVDSAQVAMYHTSLVAPVAGTVTAQNANIGETVSAGTPLVSMIANGQFEADAQVSENDIATIETGQKVLASFDAYPNTTFPATVTAVSPAATMQNGVPSYLVTVTFTGNDTRVKAGMSANLHIIVATKTGALQVPTSAIIRNGAQEFVYIRGAHGPVLTKVTTGLTSANGATEVTSGLTDGEQVLAFGASTGN